MSGEVTAPTASHMTRINQLGYEDPARVREYLTTMLRPAEVMIFVKYRDEIAGRRALDVGCGAGRVTRYLAGWTPRAVGIDFSRVMIEYCKRTFPQVEFVLCDVADLSPFADGSFDVAVCSFNAIDTLSPEGRLAALAGIRRILGPGGLLIFSSHNRRYRNARKEPRLQFSPNPATLARSALEFGRSVANRWTRRPMEREEKDYAIINDEAHEFRMLHYYIDRDAQARQLAGAGFDLLETYGKDGAVLQAGDDDSESNELYYVARRV